MSIFGPDASTNTETFGDGLKRARVDSDDAAFVDASLHNAHLETELARASKWITELEDVLLLKNLQLGLRDENVNWKADAYRKALLRGDGQGMRVILKTLSPDQYKKWANDSQLEAFEHDDKKLSDLSYAVRRNYVDVVEQLIAFGADVNYLEGQPLRQAVKHNRVGLIPLLVAAGANVHASTNKALRNAVYSGNLEAVKALLNAGANPRSEYGEVLSGKIYLMNPAGYLLRQAQLKGFTDIYKLLVQADARMDETV